MDWLRIALDIFWWIDIIFIIFLIYKGNKEPRSTFLWMLIAIIFPFFGILAYLMFGQDFKKRKMFKVKEKQDRKLRNMTDRQIDRISTGNFFFKDSSIHEYKQLIKLNLNSDDAVFSQDNEVECYFWGKEKFDQLKEDLLNAKESIDMNYYIFKNDVIGKQIIEILESKAEEGVKVRLLIDGIGGRHFKFKKSKLQKLVDKGGEYAIFFPSFLNFNLRVNYRNHRKIVVIDNAIGYTGGFNVGDEYLGKSKKFGPWRDTHVRIKGHGIEALKMRFIKDWYYASKKDINSEPDFTMKEIGQGDAGIQVITSGPDTKNANIKNAMLKMISSAKKRIFIQSPYFIPDTSLLDALKLALLSKVEVNIMIPNMPDHMIIYWATTSYAADMMKLGANVYIYDKGFMHAKVLMVDDLLTLVGSANFDERSFKLNFEASILFYDSDINKKFIKQFEKDVEDSHKLTRREYENRPLIQKIKEPICKVFSPLL